MEQSLTVLRLVGFLDVEHGDVLTVACYIAGVAFIRPRVALVVGVLNDQCTIVIYFKKKLSPFDKKLRKRLNNRYMYIHGVNAI